MVLGAIIVPGAVTPKITSPTRSISRTLLLIIDCLLGGPWCSDAMAMTVPSRKWRDFGYGTTTVRDGPGTMPVWRTGGLSELVLGLAMRSSWGHQSVIVAAGDEMIE